MSHAAAREGYAAATIAQVIEHARVSRPTFYEYFNDKNDCFVAALGAIQDQLGSDVRLAVRSQGPEHATNAAVAALVAFANSQTEPARVLMNEAMAGGPAALEVRDHGIAVIERIIEDACEDISSEASIPDISGGVLIGGVYRLLASRLRRGELCTLGLLEHLLTWMKSYERPLREHRWRMLQLASPPMPSPVIGAALRAPGPLRPGRSRLSRRELAENHRQRILLAVARLAEQKGYAATTITDITKRASVDTRAFYRLFSDKDGAFRALHELLFQNIIAVTATGFLAGTTWPERVWEGGRAFAQHMEQNPTLAYASFVDSHAGGADAVQRVEELVNGFTLFLQEGYQHKPQDRPPSPLSLQAIATSMFELDYKQVRECRIGQLSGLVPHMSFITLAPFIGPAEANKFIDRQLNCPAGSSVES